MPKFDTRVQELRYRILKEVAIAYKNNQLKEKLLEIPKIIVPGPKPSMRCCIYKERAIVEERMSLILKAKEKNDSNVIKVIPIACDECPLGGYFIGDACRGCIAHRCEQSCPKKAIYFDENQRAHINKEMCINCGLCAKNCPYNAIENRIRPCEKSCKTHAIHSSEDGHAIIDDNKCIQCGNCVYMCPFGAVVDDSYILDIIDHLNDENIKKIAVIAPSISSNFYEVKTGQVVSAIKELGFDLVVEAALGADIVALHEGKELTEKGKLTSSCCPAFVSYIKKNFPSLVGNISSSLSPMACIGEVMKQKYPDSYIVFIGPCTAKKQEIKDEKVKKYIDSAMTFEELQALIDAYGIDMKLLKEDQLNDASYFGRIFARCGGLTDAINESLKEQNIDFVAKSVACDGIPACRDALNKMKNGTLDGNFIEGMACVGGCVGGPCNLTHELKDKMSVERYGKTSQKESIKQAVEDIK